MVKFRQPRSQTLFGMQFAGICFAHGSPRETLQAAGGSCEKKVAAIAPARGGTGRHNRGLARGFPGRAPNAESERSFLRVISLVLRWNKHRWDCRSPRKYGVRSLPGAAGRPISRRETTSLYPSAPEPADDSNRQRSLHHGHRLSHCLCERGRHARPPSQYYANPDHDRHCTKFAWLKKARPSGKGYGIYRRHRRSLPLDLTAFAACAGDWPRGEKS